MNIIFILLLVSFVLLDVGCCSSNASNSGENLEQKTTNVVSSPVKHSQPTAIKSNAVKVEAIVDSVTIVDEIDFRLFITVSSISVVEGSETIAETGGQHLIVTPEFYKEGNRKIDKRHERNMKLLKLRTYKQGDRLQGIISLNSNGRWILVDVIHD
ncbi:MAG: hypothetical protein HY800_08260 [Ignavibacteriales bacterium]|nr:hypothetical protein [Ignavibacteriales bacterium]